MEPEKGVGFGVTGLGFRVQGLRYLGFHPKLEEFKGFRD